MEPAAAADQPPPAAAAARVGAGSGASGDVSPPPPSSAMASRASPHFTPPTPGTPAATPTEASGSGTPLATDHPPWETGLDVDAVAAALEQAATARPVSLVRGSRDELSSPPLQPDSPTQKAAVAAAAAAVPERAELERLYREHNPAKLASLDELIEKYGGAKLLTAAKGKYEGKSSSAKGGKSSSTGSAGGAPKQPGSRGAAGPQSSHAEAAAAAAVADPMLASLCEMGFPAQAARQALAATGAKDVQLAMNWLLEQPSAGTVGTSSTEAAVAAAANVKMVIAVRKDLGMGVGKIAAQVAHGAVDLYRTLSQQGPGSDLPIVLQQWELNGETKVVVGVKNEEALLALSAAAQQAQGVTCSIIQDAGRTEVAAGSVTVGAFIGRSVEVDKLTGHLRLLKD